MKLLGIPEESFPNFLTTHLKIISSNFRLRLNYVRFNEPHAAKEQNYLSVQKSSTAVIFKCNCTLKFDAFLTNIIYIPLPILH